MKRQHQFHSLPLLAIIGFFACTSSVWADSNAPTCSDMSEHARVLDAGMKLYNDHGGGGYGGHRGLQTDLLDLPYNASVLFDNQPPMHASQYAYQSTLLPISQIDKVSLNSESDISSAQLYAQAFEVVGLYNNAKTLYERILGARQLQPLLNKQATKATSKDIERAVACQSAIIHNLRGQQAGTANDCRQILANIKDSATLDLKTKLAIMNRVCSHITSGLSATEEARKQADQLCNEYRKESQCLTMAEDLNAGAYKLEASGMYPMAEKLYREALAIKQKNLGPNDPDTLTEYGELARLNAEQGRIPEAVTLYEQALAHFRKLPTKGEAYGLLLQSYGDMLAHANQQKKADQIYDEARIFYARSSSELAN